MIETVIFAGLFYLAYIANRSNTYNILFVLFFFNMVTYSLTSETTVIFAALLDCMVVLALIEWGDKHSRYQISLIMTGLLCHLLQEIDQITGSDVIFSNYAATITVITIMQLLGGGRGIITWISERVRIPDNNHILLHHSYYQIGEKICPKEQQKH